MIYNYFNPLFYPRFNTLNEKPPTIYAILNSIVNFGKDEEEKIKIPELAKNGRTTIFDFSYPLSKNINKEDFECMILNHYFMRRINFDTVTAFKMQLNVKLNSIMPLYNKLFDSLKDWDIFSGEEMTRSLEDKKTSNNTTNNTSDNTTNNTLTNNSSTNSSNTLDSRNSDMPQSEIENVQNADYLTNYKLDKNTANSSDNSTSTGNSTSKTTNNTTENSNENTNTKEIINRSLADKMTIYKDFQENLKSIYDLIFKDLDCLFYALI